MSRSGFSCIIPFYNEGQKFLEVLATLDQIPEIQQLICVDDGSANNTAALITQRFPEVQIIPLLRNEGKAAAVRKGLAVVREENILLMDADLECLQGEEVGRALRKFQEGFWDCLILPTYQPA